MSRFRRIALTGLTACLLATSTLAAPSFAQSGAADVVVNMRDVELSAVAEQIARITGRTLVLDPAVKGTVNVVSADPLTTAGVWDLFQSVLRVHGFAAVRSGAVWRIVPQAAAVQSGASLDVRGGVRPQDVITRLIRLQNLSAEAAARVLKPLVASFGGIEALPQPNAIVVTDYAENVRRIEALARSLDSGGGSVFESITLRYANARDIGQAIQRILGDGQTAGGPRMAVDERSNMILLRGDPQTVAEARRVAATLDVAGGTAPITRVVRLNNADAEGVTQVLRGILGGQAEATNPVARSLAGGQAASRSGGSTLNAPSPVNALAAAVGIAQPPSTASLGPADLATSGTDAAGFATADVAIQPASELNAIVLRGSPAAVASIQALVTELDVRRPQVMIEAAIVEITGDRAEQLGVQFGLGGAAAMSGSASATSFSNVGVSVQSVLAAIGAPAARVVGEGLTIASGDNDFGVLVQALGQSTKANLLSTPSITTLDNQPAEIVVGQNVPFRTGSFTTEGNSTNPFTTIQRQDVGITLRVVPRVHDGDVVRLDVSQEVSSLVNANVAGAADLITNRRSIQTTVLADNGQTIVLGGLITDDRQQTRTQVPVLGDVPVVGALFRAKKESQTRRTLFVFLRPTIMRDASATAAAAQAKYDRLQIDEALRTDPSLLLYPPGGRLTPGQPNVF